MLYRVPLEVPIHFSVLEGSWYSCQGYYNFYPQTYGQSEHTILTLDEMLKACVIDFKINWDDHLPFIEFAYDNS